MDKGLVQLLTNNAIIASLMRIVYALHRANFDSESTTYKSLPDKATGCYTSSPNPAKIVAVFENFLQFAGARLRPRFA
ncbi:hypothetical protein LJ739_17890 [Aestuariibacter halophilus]|uniref:Uncharacterized protein n=1 Tax=Fluctibacter halophilus TaxID=226011 RepID=A0ABS8GC70_9ALTE|nr:hypothetical protein [Aestuariibacter halophilus]MCC2618132.1 hypothetical protein [Aestuariibacter halophilus]